MKKTYVKPVMESELFVANEYVAACWWVYCDGSNGFLGSGLGDHDKHGAIVKSSSNEPNLSSDSAIIYNYTSYTVNGTRHYRVHKENHDLDGKRPNASV